MLEKGSFKVEIDEFLLFRVPSLYLSGFEPEPPLILKTGASIPFEVSQTGEELQSRLEK